MDKRDLLALKLLNIHNYYDYLIWSPAYPAVIAETSLNNLKRNSLLFTPELPEKIDQIFKLAEEAGITVYLVGGSVRDLLLKRKDKQEYDFIVFRKLELLLSRLKNLTEVKVITNPDYYTLNLKFADGERVDLTRPRYEYYYPPGVVKKIFHSSLFADLRRRDFTINSLVIFRQGGKHRLLDLFSGLTDIKQRKLRLIRPYGFLEDPVRMVRAVRYLQTLNLTLTKRDGKLLSEALKLLAGFNDSFLDSRFGRELRQLLEEIARQPENFVDNYPVFNLLDRAIRVKRQELKRLLALVTLLNHKQKPCPEDILLLFILSRVDKERAMQLLTRMNYKIKNIDYQKYFTYSGHSAEQIIKQAPSALIDYLLLVNLARSNLSLAIAKEKFSRYLTYPLLLSKPFPLEELSKKQLGKFYREIKLQLFLGGKLESSEINKIIRDIIAKDC